MSLIQIKMKNLITIIFLLAGTQVIGQITSITIEEAVVHTGMVGTSDLTGFTTYEIYGNFTNPSDWVSIVYGHETAPLFLANSGEVFNSELGGTTIYETFPTLLLTAFPEMEFDSYLALGSWGDNTTVYPIQVSLDSTQFAAMQEGEDLVVNDSLGGGWFHSAIFANISEGQEAGPEMKILLAQITATEEPYGCFNVQTFIGGDTFNAHQGLALHFGDPALLYGCMDPLANNYNEYAYLEGAPCAFGPIIGDFNGNGEVNVEDLLLILTEFGCLVDCLYDLDGDGDVDVADLLNFLGLF